MDEEENSQLEAGQNDVAIGGNEGKTVEPTEPTNNANDISQEQEGAKTGGKKVLVPDYLPHRYERYKRQAEERSRKLAENERYIAELEGKIQPRDAYGDDVDKYVADRSTLSAQRALAEREQSELKGQTDRAHEEYLNDIWTTKIQEARQAIPDWDSKVSALNDIRVSKEGQKYLMENPFGVDVLYHLASNPEIAKHLNFMSPQGQVNFINQQASFVQMQNYGNQNQTPRQVAPVKPAPAPLGAIPNAKPTNNNVSDMDWVKSFRGMK